MGYLRVQTTVILLLAGVLAARGTGEASEVFPAGSGWRYFPGLSEASAPDPAAWRTNGFDDSTWLEGNAPYQYGFGNGGTELGGMRGRHSTVYLRRTFVVPDPAPVESLLLRARCDDGFVAWINGREAARYNAPEGDPAFDATAPAAIAAAPLFEDYEIPRAYELLLPGTNVLAVLALNASLDGSEDFLFDAGLEAAFDTAPPAMELVEPAPGSTVRELAAIEVHFTERVWGVDAADLLVNGAPATNVTEVVPGQFVFTFPELPDGEVAVRWRAGHGIADRLGAMHPFAGGAWSYTLDSRTPPASVILSEFMADNRRTLNDEDGNSPDWIELFNSADNAVRLDGWFLTDTAATPGLWRFPDVAIPGRGFLVVFASGKNRTNLTGRLHTNFKLKSEGGYLALVSPDLKAESEFAAYPPQYEDVSYGRVPGDPDSVGYFTKATPGALNASSGPGFAPAVEFSRAGGTFVTPFLLSLRAGSATNIQIRYTMDGSLPTNSSRVYTKAFYVTNSAQVRARAYGAGLLPGPPRSEAFLWLSNNLVTFTSDLPVMVIHALGKGTPTSSRYTFAAVSLHEPILGRTSLTNAPTLTSRAGIRVRGSSTEGIAKSSFALEWRDEFDLDLDREVLGMPAESDWVLYAPNQFEPVLIHNPFVHQLSRDMGRYSPRTRFVEVYLNKVTGPVGTTHYNGIYVLEEKIKIGPERVAIDRLEPEHLAAPRVTGGYLLKIDRLDPSDTGFAAGGVTVCYVDPKERDIKLAQRDPQEQYVKSYFAAFAKALTATNWKDPVAGYAAYIDVPASIDYHVREVLSGNVDALVLSCYFHKPREGRITFGPHWDFDRALGSTDGRDANPRIWTTGPFFTPAWWNRMFQDVDFWQQWVDRWQANRQGPFALTNLHGLVDRLASQVRQAEPREQKKWPLSLRGGSYQGEVNLMKNWLSNRVDFIDKQFVPLPVLSFQGGPARPGFTFTLGAPANVTVFYTLDGSDPRLPQGGVSPRALTYVGAVPVQSTVRVVARGRNLSQRQSGGPPVSTPWSGAVAATFAIGTPALLVTEIMFHPDVPAGATNSEPDFEFVEIANAGDQPVNLTGYAFTDGIRYVFSAQSGVTNLAPGGRVLLAKNLAAFGARYGAVPGVAGEYEGALNNGGERLTLVGPLLEPVLDFAYSDAWQPLADGAGFSLVLKQETLPAANLGQASSWRLSSRPGGSPGAADPAPPAIPPVLVNEVLAAPLEGQSDALELYNPNSVPVDLDNWFLSDEFLAPRKCRLSGSIPALGFRRIDEGDLRSATGSGFAFSRFGDEVHLFSADPDGALTGWHHGFSFGPSEPGATFGRHVTSTGAEHFVPQEQATLGGANTGPRVGPVVLTELMVCPPLAYSQDDRVHEFVELQNLGREPVALFDPARPANTWRVSGTVEFAFPPAIVLAPAETVLLVGFPPDDTLLAPDFRARYRLDPAVRLFGPWQGALGNDGGSVRLSRPGQPDAGADAQPPWLTVEEVDYLRSPPWPVTAPGVSLHRCRLPAYANDPANWVAGPPTPGTADADGDGLPDGWELANGLDPLRVAGQDGAEGDPDGDGYSNLQEWLGGTDPQATSSRPTLEVDWGAGATVGLRFLGAPGRTYTVCWSSDLAGGAWQPLGTIRQGSLPVPATLWDTPQGATRFYRLQTQ